MKKCVLCGVMILLGVFLYSMYIHSPKMIAKNILEEEHLGHKVTSVHFNKIKTLTDRDVFNEAKRHMQITYEYDKEDLASDKYAPHYNMIQCKRDSFILDSLDKLEESFGKCESVYAGDVYEIIYQWEDQYRDHEQDTAFVFMVGNKVYMAGDIYYPLQPEYDYLLYDIYMSKVLYPIIFKAEDEYPLDKQAEIELEKVPVIE